MARAPTLVALAAAADQVAHEAKQERARAMDALIDLLFERAAYRGLMKEALPYLDVAVPRYSALQDKTPMPQVLAQAIREVLEEP